MILRHESVYNIKLIFIINTIIDNIKNVVIIFNQKCIISDHDTEYNAKIFCYNKNKWGGKCFHKKLI